MISALHWVPRKAVSTHPHYYQPTEEEVEQWKREADEQIALDEAQGIVHDLDAADEDEDEDDSEMEDEEEVVEQKESATDKAKRAAKAMKTDQKDDLSDFNLDTYDDEPDMNIGPNMLGTCNAAFESNFDDPLMTEKDDDPEEDEEDVVIRDTDAVVLTLKNDDDANTLEVNIYDQVQGVLYLHHDIMLPAFPLCVAWLDFNASVAGNSGNYAAVGTMDEGIEIWDLDVIDTVEPVCSLGGEDLGAVVSGGKKKKSKKSKKALVPGSHTGPVLGLSWNVHHRNILASASADNTVKLWDIGTAQCGQTLTHHTDKVQAVEFHPSQATVLATGGFDKIVAILDVREATAVSKTALPHDIECVTWNPHSPNNFLVSTDQGQVSYFDVRKIETPVFSLGAHTQGVTGLHFNPLLPNCFATSSLDKIVKIWDIKEDSASLVCTRDISIGQIFCCQWARESPFVLAAAGAKGKLCVWDTAENAAMRGKYGSKIPGLNLDEYEAADLATSAIEGMNLNAPAAAASSSDTEFIQKKNKKNKKKK